MKEVKVLFHRTYGGFTGGHFKFNDYLDHLESSEFASPYIYIDPSSSPDHIWQKHARLIHDYDPLDADVLFLAGLDWRALKEYPCIDEKKIIFNLIQGMRHADPTHELYSYLSRKAIRICVSPEVRNAIVATGRCNGPVHIIPNGICHESLPTPKHPLSYDIFISGIKRRGLALDLNERLQQLGLTVDCIIEPIPRDLYLSRVAQAQVIIVLPYAAEGFYLPALEAMALKKPVVCLDCIGNRSFCHHEKTCLIADTNSNDIIESALKLFKDNEFADWISRNGFIESQWYNLKRERKTFLKIFNMYTDRRIL